MKTKNYIFHLLPNAHLDPVWLWDWKEGLNEGLTTCRTILDLMEEFPQLTFVRGEAAIYEHIEKTDLPTFRRIARMIELGRWDVVGGTYIQPDSNLASTETLCRQFEVGLRYFENRFGLRPSVSWQADSFGHTPGWPNILSSFGMKDFTFTRPQRSEFPLESPAFWWEGSHQNRLLCYRQHWKWYCSERSNLPEILNHNLEESSRSGFQHVGILMGLGNHGGGPSRRHILDAAAWQKTHPNVEVRFSTLHQFFHELRLEVKKQPAAEIPIVKGDLGYCLRGCYSSVQKFKSLYRQAEASVSEAESTAAIISHAVNQPPRGLDEAWKSILFNAFHDILPGSSIERAMQEQSEWTGMALHQSREARFEALNLLASQVDTSVGIPSHLDRPHDVPFLIWNSRPSPFRGLVELEASLDYRPLYEFENRADEVPVIALDSHGKPLPLQTIQTEHSSMPNLPWRKRVAIPLEIPSWGWSVVRLGWRDKHSRAPLPPGVLPAKELGDSSITNGDWAVTVADESVRIGRQGRNFWAQDRNIELHVVEDPWGSWGGMNEEKDSYCLETIREKWKRVEHQILETGPLRAKLWTRWRGKNSWLDLAFVITAGCPWLTVEGRLLWNERSARLKLIMPCAGETEFDVPGGTMVRQAEGQLPSGRWLRRVQEDRVTGFASDVLSDVDLSEDQLRITLARATRYANDVPTGPNEKLWQPAVDCGELKFQFCLFGKGVSPDSVADSLLFPPAALISVPKKGALSSQGSFGHIHPESVCLLAAQKLSSGNLRIRIQNRGINTSDCTLNLAGKSIKIKNLKPKEIRTMILDKESGLSKIESDPASVENGILGLEKVQTLS